MKATDDLSDRKSTDSVTLVGLQVGSCTVTELIDTGRYFQTYLGIMRDGTRVVIKVPGALSNIQFSDSVTNAFCAGVFACEMGGRIAVDVPAESIFLAQLTRLLEVNHKSLVAVLESSNTGCQWFSMPFIDGKSLRDSITSDFSLHSFYDLAIALQELEDLGWQHLDLKPENVLLTSEGVQLIDPGYHGKLALVNGAEIEATVTTLAYNPLLQPDDKLAFGLMLWEFALGEPLSNRLRSCDLSAAGLSLCDWINCLETTGNFELSYFLNLQKPSNLIAGCSEELERLLLLSVGLELKSGMIELRDDVASWSEIIKSIELVNAESRL